MQENELDRYVSRNARIIMLTISIASSVYFFVLRPLQYLEDEVFSIKNNHLVHVQDSLDRIESNLSEDKKENRLRDESLTRIETLLNNHIDN